MLMVTAHPDTQMTFTMKIASVERTNATQTEPDDILKLSNLDNTFVI